MAFGIWGCGRKFLNILKTFPNITRHIDFYFDENMSNICGMSVCNPSKIYEDSSMIVIICTYSKEIREEIRSKLIFEYGLDESRIWNEEQMIAFFLEKYDDVEINIHEVRVETSTLCQLNCVSCPMRLEQNAKLGKGYLSSEDFDLFLSNNKCIHKIEISNYGEVFLNPELDEIIKVARRYGVELTINNGVNLNYMKEGIEEILVESEVVKNIVVSIDGVTQGVYEKYRKNGDIGKVFDNIQRINVAKEKYGTDYPILYWQYILFEHNEDEVEAAIMLAKQLKMQILFKMDWDGEFVPRNIERMTQLTGLKFFNRKKYFSAEKEDFYSTCNQLIYSPQINYDGRLLGCCSTRNNDWGINVFNYGISKAVNDKRYKDAVISLLLGKPVDNDTPCAKCERIKKGLLVQPRIILR